MTPNVFTATAGSVFVPDNSTFENNDPTNVSTVALNGGGIAGQPLGSVGGHNWEFDQGSTTCKAVSTSSGNPPIPVIAGQAPAGWILPPNTTTDCFVLPVAKYDTLTIVTNTVTGQVTSSNSISNSNCTATSGTLLDRILEFRRYSADEPGHRDALRSHRAGHGAVDAKSAQHAD
jgi:hypothetical protein